MGRQVLAGAVVVLGLGGCAFEQPPTPCVVGRGGHAVRYTLKSASALACAKPKRAETVPPSRMAEVRSFAGVVPAILDGEPTVLHGPVRITLDPAAARVVVPERLAAS